MWTDDVRTSDYGRRLASIVADAAGDGAPLVITLGIETSCDETAVAVVEDGFTLRANLIASQVHLHERFGGVVPEVAARAHVEALNPLMEEALAEAEIGFGDIDAVAVTVGPGLVGALLVGMAAAKGVALATGADLVGVNHLEAHYWANFLEHGDPRAAVRGADRLRGTHDVGARARDAAPRRPRPDARRCGGRGLRQGGATAGLGFPGGPALDAMATDGDPNAIRFPRAMEDSGDYDFSMSGLKTAVLRYVQAGTRGRPRPEPARSRRELPGGDRRRAGVEGDGRRQGRGRADRAARWRRRRQLASARRGSPRRASAKGSACSARRCPCARTTRPWWRAWATARWKAGERTMLDIGADPQLRLAP